MLLLRQPWYIVLQIPISYGRELRRTT